MALLCSKVVTKTLGGQFSVPCRLYAIPKYLPDPMELATGLEKYQKLEKMKGNLDPFKTQPKVRLEKSTKENPNIVPSFLDMRLLMCSCNPDNSALTYMWLLKGEPRRCACNHWFKLEVINH